MMFEGWNCENINDVKGRTKIFWTQKATELFSSGICHPSKGDVGEVAAALYLLFCGDIIRRGIDDNLMTFSVDLPAYIHELIKNQSPNAASQYISNTSNPATKKVKITRNYSPESIDVPSTNAGIEEDCDPKCRISFIQVVRQSFRMKLRDLCSPKNLEQLYRSSCGLYLPVNHKTFDILASIQVKSRTGTLIYRPFAVSVNSQRNFSVEKAKLHLHEMEVTMKKCNKNVGALCLLVLLNVDKINTYGDCPLLQDTDCNCDVEEDVVTKILLIKSKDRFGISDLIQMTRLGKSKFCEPYSSHFMLRNFANAGLKTNSYDKDTLSYINGILGIP
jgi:hypothetical protein